MPPKKKGIARNRFQKPKTPTSRKRAPSPSPSSPSSSSNAKEDASSHFQMITDQVIDPSCFVEYGAFGMLKHGLAQPLALGRVS